MLKGVVLAALVLGCCLGCNADPETASTPAVSATPTPTPSATPTGKPTPVPCSERPPERRRTVNDFVVELDIMSGNPNPRWKLTAAQARELRARLLRGEGRIVGVGDGPARLGYRGFILRSAPSQRAFLRLAGLEEEFKVAGPRKPDGRRSALEIYLDATMPCSAFG